MLKQNKNINPKQFEKDMLEKFQELFSNSEFWFNYPQNYNKMKRFCKQIVKEVEEKTKIYCLEQYQDFYEELKKEDKLKKKIK